MKLDLVAEFLREHDNYEILTHAYPDGDTLGSGYALCLALQQLGKNARVITTDLPKDFTFLLEGVKVQGFDAQTIVSIDVAVEKLLGSNKESYSGKIQLCIDTTTKSTGWRLSSNTLRLRRRLTAKSSTACSA